MEELLEEVKTLLGAQRVTELQAMARLAKVETRWVVVETRRAEVETQ